MALPPLELFSLKRGSPCCRAAFSSLEESIFSRRCPSPLNVIEQCHKAEVHVQLLVAVEQGEARIVRNEVDLDFLVAADHRHIFDHSRSRQTGNPRQLKAVPMQMDRMNIVAGIA